MTVLSRTETLELDFGVSEVHFGAGLSTLKALVGDRRVFLMTDMALYKSYSDEITEWEYILLPEGEEVKTLRYIDYFSQVLLNKNVDRNDVLLAFGGGAICDFVGFLASIYKRGIPFIFVPTTVLAQVDAAIGGKTAVNHHELKNMLGVFSCPEHILIDPRYCLTQTKDGYRQGFAELIKHALIKDKELFTLLVRHADALVGKDIETLSSALYRGAQIKMDVVRQDSCESNERKLLNFGHTIGHAIEKIQQLTHGDAVSIGMTVAMKYSEKLGFMSQSEVDSALELLQKYGLMSDLSLAPEIFWPFLRKDKKTTGDEIDYVLLNGIGNAFVQRLSFSELRESIDAIYEES